MDVPKNIQPECFSVQGGGDATLPGITDARLMLETRGDVGTLFVTTRQAINEPVLQVTLAAACADLLKRDYVLLLDPPSGFEPATVAAHPETGAASERSTSKVSATRSSRRRGAAHRAPVRSAKSIQTARSGGAAAPVPRANSRPTGSRLVLSGGRYRPDPAVDAALGLRLDMSLPDLARPRPPAGLNPTDLSDENTALNHKLAHLETQLIELQKRNNDLEAARARRPEPTPKASNEKAPWSRYLIIFGLLAGGVALSFGLRRRTRASVSGGVHEPWIPPAPLQGPEAPSIPTPDTQKKEKIAVSRPPASAGPAVFSQSPSSKGTEVKEDILDQAEVYMAHGHANLAVHLLQEHLRQAPTESPVPWLLLLDLLKRDGLEAEYRETSIACQSHFNVNLSAPPAVTHTPDGSSIEAYPHIAAHLQKVWGSREAVEFLTDLVYDHRGGTRQGFDPDTYREIVMLRTIAQEYGA